MGFTIETGISALAVFVQGLLSFFSPCVLPLVPLYLSYLSAGVNGIEEGGEGKGGLRLFFRVLLFSLGISAAFFILGLGVSAAAMFFNDNRMLLARIGGILIILFGLYQLGVFGTSKVLGNEHRLPFQMERITSSPLTAFLMGFTFSFAWTPCVGPALTSVLIMAGSAQTSFKGFLLIGVYTIGFILPFLLAGIFTARLLGFFRRHMSIVRYTAKAGGVLMILMGLLMFTGSMNDITGYLSRFQAAGESSYISEDSDDTYSQDPTHTGGQSEDKAEHAEASASREEAETEDAGAAGSASDESISNDSSVNDSPSNDSPSNNGSDDDSSANKSQTEDSDRIAAYDFELYDQFGETHRLSDYEGKAIFLNFWATWCPPCKAEMPDIQELYERYEAEGDEAEVAILGVAAPNMGSEGSEGEIAAFMEENGYTYPVLMDTSWDMFRFYGITAFPTTFMIDKEGYVYGYVPGQMSMDIMESIIEQTLNGGV